jgi:membrane protease YdiL (CAAX protease family)
MPFPPAPRILVNQEDLQFALVMTLVSQVFLAALVVLVARQGLRGFIERTRLGDINFGRVWLILGCVVAAYVSLFLYSLGAAATGISWLEPNSTVPDGVTRDDFTLTLTGLVTLIGAPVSEEFFFRGLVFGGLLRWGFWPAALLSGFMFSLVHFDPGSLLPFIAIAVLICWIYWRRGSLWDAVAFHFFFNATSFSIMVAIS